MRPPRYLSTFCIILALFFPCAPAVRAQDAPAATVELNLASPAATMQTFLSATGPAVDGKGDAAKAWTTSIACFDFPPPQQGVDPNLYRKAHRADARNLLAILDRIGTVYVNNMPDAIKARASRITTYTYFPLRDQQAQQDFEKRLEYSVKQTIELVEVEPGVWKFSQQTISGLDAFYDAVIKLPPVHERQSLPFMEVLGPTFEQTSYFGWAALAGLIFLGVVLGKIISIALKGIGNRFVKREQITRGTTFLSVAGPANLAFIAAGLMIGLRFIAMEKQLGSFTWSLVQFLFLIAIGWLFYNLVDVINMALVGLTSKTASKLDDQLVPLISKTMRIFLVVIFTLVIAQNVFDVDITAWLAGLGIAGLAVSLSAQDSIKNLFGSITVLFDKPFVVGDWVVINDLEGIVEEVGFRSTRIRTFYNSQITLPNANLINASVDNYGRRRYRRWKTTLGVQYDTTPDQLIAFTEGVRELVRIHPYTRKDYYEVYCNDFGDSSLNIMLYMFFEVPDWNTELRERERLFVDIVRLADQLGVQFAFPTHTVHLYKEEHKPHETASQPPQSMTERRAMVKGVKAVHALTANQPWIKQKPEPVVITTDRTDIKLDDAGNPIIEKDDEETV